jgi:hypothetical protein
MNGGPGSRVRATRATPIAAIAPIGIPPISRTHPLMPLWQLEVCDGNRDTTEVYGGIQA